MTVVMILELVDVWQDKAYIHQKSSQYQSLKYDIPFLNHVLYLNNAPEISAVNHFIGPMLLFRK